ncbi:UNVERIFIED_CONTAM: hypothetical protein PYX00_009454 [Menopon gallinae]|uniref:ubiquitinyl hydrolase 1 n=2 Tax=Menopon gallinae TaxID=328185 RepID=A0AAW2HBQ1_9NEOP
MFSWLKIVVKDSKQNCLLYEDAIKRVTESELKRLREAFKKASSANGFISKTNFIKDVLGDGVPGPISEIIYTSCGGTSKGIAFKDLICGLVLLTRGTQEEKIKFLFGLYSNENGTAIVKEDFYKLIQGNESVFIADQISRLFQDKNSANFETFREWLIMYPDATCLSRWLLVEPWSVSLSNDVETPTFYQTLCGVTHLEEHEMIELEKRYWSLKNSSRSGKLDLETLTPLLHPVLPSSVCHGLFSAFDENQDNHIDFKEMACGVSAACRGPAVERQKFCFKVFDADKDGYLNSAEMKHMIDTFLTLKDEEADEKKRQPILLELENHISNPKCGLAQEEYLIWAVKSDAPKAFLNLLFQMCHIILALRPANPLEEGEIVMNWLKREEEINGLAVGQFWYLIDMAWWKQWQAYTRCDGCPGPPETNGEYTSNPKTTNNSLKAYTTVGSNSPNQSPHAERKQISKVNWPPRPGPIINTNLIQPPSYKVQSLTGEGGKLKKNLLLTENRDFRIVPQSLWTALTLWYGGEPALPRQVILSTNTQTIELELYPINLRFLRHVAQNNRQQANNWTGMVGGYGASAVGITGTTGYAYVTSLTPTPKRYLAYVGAFSRMATLKQMYQYLCNKLRIRFEDMRLWLYRDENNMFILEEEDSTLEELGILDEDQILIEVRNKDLTWPEEMNSIAYNAHNDRRQAALEKGATGLNNLGNTCFMNAALQCVSNTQVLTQYFTSKMHLYELNRDNPLGMKGHIALRYADLIDNIWSGSSKTIAPLKLRWTIGKYAPRFNGFQQHDSQELLAFLLDGLHEDLNRVHDKPYLELKDSDGRPDVIVAQEAWENHILRNKSIIVDLFHGQLKSKVTCNVCSHESVRFDPFNYLSLPLPMESYLHFTITVIKLDGSVPVKYGLRLNNDEKYSALKSALSSLCGIPPYLIKLAEVQGALIKHVYLDDQRIKGTQGGHLYGYELPQSCNASLDEEKLSISSTRSQTEKEREASTFTAIQRAINPINVQNIATDGPAATTWLRGAGDTGDLSSEVDPAESNANQTQNASLLSSASSSMGSIGPTPSQRGAVEGCVPHSSAHSSSSGSLANLSDTGVNGFVVALHRKMIRQETYFLSSLKTKPSLFGLPVIVPCGDMVTHQDLYQSVWTQVARLVSPLPPGETANHATDCDDSLGYEFPFTLKAVTRDGNVCALCPWYRFCRGCRIQCSSAEFTHNTNYIAIDWDPTALHLRYQTCLERVVIEHESVARTRQQMSEPIGLDHCLEAFTREETLSEDEKVYCSHCKSHEIATKKLQIWRLPPILIVHLKRFQYVNGKWVKSQKVVDFPVKGFDPTLYLASVPKETVLRHREISNDTQNGIKVKIKNDNCICNNSNSVIKTDSNCNYDECEAVLSDNLPKITKRDRLESTSLMTTPIEDASLQDFHQHRLVPGADPFDLKYNLYSVVCHSGMLGGGHYVSYACNPRGVWYCYNDSSCKQVSQSQMDLTSAYMLFYEREGLCHSQYMPSIVGKLPDSGEIDEDVESDLKKMCSLQ